MKEESAISRVEAVVAGVNELCVDLHLEELEKCGGVSGGGCDGCPIFRTCLNYWDREISDGKTIRTSFRRHLSAIQGIAKLRRGLSGTAKGSDKR